VSGSLRIDQRPGLQALTEVIEAGKASAVLVVSVDRITRDEDLITPTAFANLCKKYRVLIITDDYIFDFNNPTRDDMGRFMNEAIAAKEYIRKQIKGKMLKNRTRKANMGRVANGVAPVGLMLDESRNNLVPSPHAERVNWLYGRFRAHSANLASLLHEIINMARRGEPLFLDNESIDPKTVYLKRIAGGWTIATRSGLKHVLSNPMYAGHLVFNGRIVKRNAHAAIVDADNWQYAFEHLAEVDLDGNEFERTKRVVRYTQQDSTVNTALLFGIRHGGKPVIGGVNGAHVYVQNFQSGLRYVILNRQELSVSGFEASVGTKEADRIIEDRLLYWLRASERACVPVVCDHAPHVALGGIVEQVEPTKTTVQSDLDLTNQELARVERALRTSADMMDDTELRETYAKKTRLLKRRAELEHAQEQEECLAREREQARDDIQSAGDKWASWTLEKKRQFIRLVTESVTLEEIANGWLRLTVVWSPIMGFVYPTESSTRAVDVAYVWRQAGNVWSEDEIDTLRVHHPSATRNELLHMLPSRSWKSILNKAKRLGVDRPVTSSDTEIPVDTSLSDIHVLTEFKLDRKPVQWVRDYLSNGNSLS
jgi:hypothetical protein